MRLVRLPLIGDVATPLFSEFAMDAAQADRARVPAARIPINEAKLAARHHLLTNVGTHRAMIRTVRRWSANRISREASLIRQPTLLVWGEEDTHLPLSEGYRLRDAIPNARLVVFRNCGHLPPQEYPEKFVEAVTEFCKAEKSQDKQSRPLEFKQRKTTGER